LGNAARYPTCSALCRVSMWCKREGQADLVFMRGTNSNHVNVLIDGIDVSDPSNPSRSFDFGQLLTTDIAQVEVLRGLQSGLYGADALGGVIAVTTKKGEGKPKITGTMEGGSFGTFNQTASASGSEGAFNYSLKFGHDTGLELLRRPKDKTSLTGIWNRTHASRRPLQELLLHWLHQRLELEPFCTSVRGLILTGSA
jgi:hypothetical protein